MICVYTITHPATGVYYIGSTINLKKRRSNHLTALRTGKHTSEKLQAAYDTDPNIKWSAVIMPNEETARWCEYEQIRVRQDDPLLSNRFGLPLSESHKTAISESKMGYHHSAETLEKMSAARKGVPKSQEWIDKIVGAKRISVVIDGVVYKSASDAAKAFNTSPKTVLNRIKNESPKFINWQFT